MSLRSIERATKRNETKAATAAARDVARAELRKIKRAAAEYRQTYKVPAAIPSEDIGIGIALALDVPVNQAPSGDMYARACIRMVGEALGISAFARWSAS